MLIWLTCTRYGAQAGFSPNLACLLNALPLLYVLLNLGFVNLAVVIAVDRIELALKTRFTRIRTKNEDLFISVG